MPWSQLVDLLERLKAVRYTAEGETIVQASRTSPELAAILKKLDISAPKPILAVGLTPPAARSAVATRLRATSDNALNSLKQRAASGFVPR